MLFYPQNLWIIYFYLYLIMADAYLLETPIGYLLYEQGKILEKEFFNLNIGKISKIFQKINEDEIPEEILEFGTRLNKLNINNILTENPQTKEIFSKITEKNVNTSLYDPIFKDLRNSFPQEIKHLVPELNDEKLMEITKSVAEKITKKNIQESGEQIDVHIKQMVDTIEDSVKFINVFAVRLREWYGIHFPELTDNLVSDSKLYAEIVSLIGQRENITTENLIDKLNLSPENATIINEQAKDSMGSELKPNYMNMMKKLSSELISLIVFRDDLEKDLENILNEFSPNLLKVLGAKLAGKLITQAGSLKNLALMPSSTIQVLGAEKALFRSIKKKTDSPKHGLIYRWPQIRAAKHWQRGKISRMLAGKISIAAKIDYFKGNYIGDQILEEIEKKIEEIKERYPEPPKKKNISKKEIAGQKETFQKYGGQKRKELAKRKGKQFSKSRYKKGMKNKGRRS